MPKLSSTRMFPIYFGGKSAYRGRMVADFVYSIDRDNCLNLLKKKYKIPLVIEKPKPKRTITFLGSSI